MVRQHQQENHDANWTVETKSKGFTAALSAEAWVRGVTDRATAAEVAAGLLPCRIAFLIAEGEKEEGGNKGECQGGASLSRH